MRTSDRTLRFHLLCAAAVILMGAVAAQAMPIATIDDMLAVGDLTQTGRVFRDGVPSIWAFQKPFPGVLGSTSQYHYRTYDVDPGPYPYIQVVLNDFPTQVFSVAYLDSYNPDSIQLPNLGLDVNYIGDAGSSGPGWYQVYVPLGHDLILVMSETVAGGGGLGRPYSLIVEGYYDTQYNDTPPVPEPGTGLMAAGALALAALAAARRRIREGRRVLLAAVVVLAITVPVMAQPISPSAAQQIADLALEKSNRTPAQKKMDSQLVYAVKAQRGEPLGPSLRQMDSAVQSVQADANGIVTVDLRANNLAQSVSLVTGLGGQAIYASARSNSVLAKVPLVMVETLAGNAAVRAVRLPPRAMRNRSTGSRLGLPAIFAPLFVGPPRLAFFTGSVTTQGYVTHRANVVQAGGTKGAGVKVGVLSDSVESLALLKGTGDLPLDTTVLAGQEGSGTSEGTAMMEIVYDMAPAAKLYFATAFTSEDSFADNIRALRAAGCHIIVDDVSYGDEGVFQDTTIAQAVNDVVADGALYFSSAANSGNLTFGTSGTYEGDFVNSGVYGPPPYPFWLLHNFGGGQTWDTLTGVGGWITLQWSDPWGGSTNDYDLIVLDSTGTTVTAASWNTQGPGYPWPFEGVDSGFGSGSRVVVGLWSGDVRALHIDTGRGRLQIATTGATYGHNGGANTVSTAATYWNSAKRGTVPFTGAANPIEYFSSDGPRRIFFWPNGAAITPGNYRFATNGGLLLQKPDITAADGVVTRTPGFWPFYGTSAAAPHAAAIAALVKSAKPGWTNAQIRNAIQVTALDNMAAGWDRDGGWGIAMADGSVNYAKTH